MAKLELGSKLLAIVSHFGLPETRNSLLPKQKELEPTVRIG
jgi:hypothetical protein